MSNIEKFTQVETYILEQIRSGRLLPGQQIPTEKQLQEQFSLSRMTVNKALRHLAEQGYIHRTPGKGSFVSVRQTEKTADTPLSFTEDMERLGMKAGSRLLSYEMIRARKVPAVREALRLKDDDLVHFFVRLRTADGRPLALTKTYVPVKYLSAADISGLDHSFYAWLRSRGIVISRADQRLSAVMPDESEKDLLKISQKPVLRNTKTAYIYMDGEHLPFEYSVSDYSGDLYSFAVSSVYI